MAHIAYRPTLSSNAALVLALVISLSFNAFLILQHFQITLSNDKLQSIPSQTNNDQIGKSTRRHDYLARLDVAQPSQEVRSDSSTQHLANADPRQITSYEASNHHIVFIGDSILRYSYLEWLDTIQFSRSPGDYSPNTLINEKLSTSWHEYFTNTTAHFEGNMFCDCRRSEEFDLNVEVENRYYQNGNLWATYIQLPGDNMAHGRFSPGECSLAKVSIADGPNKDTSGYTWGYMGADSDKLISEYVSQFSRKPSAIVMNAGMWPNEGIAFNLGNIVKAAKEVLVSEGKLIWRATSKRKHDLVASTSPADDAAKDWSYRLPYLIYQAFPKLDISPSDYFDDNHFGNSRIYREWNADLMQALGTASDGRKKSNRVFIIVGAVRTLHKTEQSILNNMIYPLCPPPDCIAHLVIHLSYADNRPSVVNHDGESITANEDKRRDYFEKSNWTEGHLVVHRVDGYEIGSREEQSAMDVMENEEPEEVAKRMKIFRISDPRRYSMWFARAWAWRHVLKLHELFHFDFFTFGRPDLLWLIPAPTWDFFEDFSEDENTVWMQDAYFSFAPDTFAFIQNFDAANKYFSLPLLVQKGGACIGGPNFNRTLTMSRLGDANILTDDDDWCSDESHGWSEHILLRKMKTVGLTDRYFPAAAALVREPANPLCESLRPYFTVDWIKHNRNNIAHFACLAADKMISLGKSNEEVLETRPFILRGKTFVKSSTCLTLSPVNYTLHEAPCKNMPVPTEQLFMSVPASQSAKSFLYSYHENKAIVLKYDLEMFNDGWTLEPAELYSKHTLDIVEIQ
ncbi:hypothetical protein ACHAXS_007721 [Conticribra weissflogii]